MKTLITPTISDVAEAAGVSVATVSRVTSGLTGVHPDTKDRVMKAILGLNYTPHVSAQNMRWATRRKKQRAGIIGFLSSRAAILKGDTFAHEIASAIEAAICRRGMGIRVLPASEDGGIPMAISHHEVDGVVARMRGPLLRQIAQQVPIVSLDVFVQDADVYSLVPDYEQAAYDVAKRLLKAGHRRIALLCPPPSNGDIDFWTLVPRGTIRAFESEGLAVPQDLYWGAAGAPEQGYEIGLRMLRTPGRRPDAVLGPDAAILGVYRAAGECGVRIPEDVSIVGVNNLPASEYLHPPLTTVDVGIAALANDGIRILMECIDTSRNRKGMEFTRTKLIERASARI